MREGGRPVTHYQDFIAHTGATDWRHTATAIDMDPIIPELGTTTVQSTLEQFYGFVAGVGTGFVSIGYLDGYTDGYAVGVYNVGSPSTLTFEDAVTAALADSRLENGGVLLILPGYYRVSSTINIPAGITVLGSPAGSYIVGETSGSSIFNVQVSSKSFNIGGDTGSGAEPVINGTGVFQTRFENLIITDNSDGYANSGDPTLSGTDEAMITVERSANVSFNKVSFIGKLKDGLALNRLKTTSAIYCSSLGASTGTSVHVTNCYMDGLKTPILFDSQLGNKDYLSVKNSKIRFYGKEAASYAINEDNFVKSSLCNIEIENNYIAGEGAHSKVLLNVTSTAVTSTNCSIKIIGNSGYSVSDNSVKLCEYENSASVYSIMSGNSWAPVRPGNNSWTVVIGETEGDIIGSNALNLFLSTYDSSYRNPTKIVLNPGTYTVTVSSGTFYGLKLEGNPIGKYYPIINLNLSAGSNDDFTNRYIGFGNIKNIYFKSTSNFSSIHAYSKRDLISAVAGENISIENCIFKDTNLYIDVGASNSTTNATGSQESDSTKMTARISDCRFYQSGTFSENWSLYIPNINTVKLENSYFHGAGYALTYGPSPSVLTTGTNISNFTIDNCTFDVASVTINALPPAGSPYYININGALTKCKIQNSIFICSTTGDSNAAIFSGVATASRFINLLSKDTYIKNCYFNTPGYTYTSPASYPMAGVYAQWRNTLHIENNVFNSGGVPLKIVKYDTGSSTTADQYYCNISHNRFTQLSNFYTILDADVGLDGTDSAIRKIFIDSNLFVNRSNTSSTQEVEHTDVSGVSYDVAGIIQLYLIGASLNFTNNELINNNLHTPGSFTNAVGVYCNTYSSSGYPSSVDFSNNNIDFYAANLNEAGGYHAAVYINSNNIKVNDNHINCNGGSGSVAEFRGCLLLKGRQKGSAGDGIVTGNLFDRTSTSGSLTDLKNGYVYIHSDTDYRGQITHNSFISPIISLLNTNTLIDNTTSSYNWLFTYNKNQTQTINIYGSCGQIGLQTYGALNTFYALSGLVDGVTTYNSYAEFSNSNSSTNVKFHYKDNNEDQRLLWSIPLKSIVPEGAYVIGAQVDMSVNLTPTTGTGSLQLLNSLDDESDTINFNTTSSGTLTVTRATNDFIVQGTDPVRLDIIIRIDTNSSALVASIENVSLTYRF